jgi:hypothetical protein
MPERIHHAFACQDAVGGHDLFQEQLELGHRGFLFDFGEDSRLLARMERSAMRDRPSLGEMSRIAFHSIRATGGARRHGEWQWSAFTE